MGLSEREQYAVVCHAPEDTGIARELAAFLELNCPVSVSCEDTAPDLLEAVERATAADVVLVVLSPFSVPKAWKREQWEPVLLKTPREYAGRMAFLLAGNCKFPELLRRKNFFDGTLDRPAAFRAVKRWLLEDGPGLVDLPNNPVENLAPEILDRIHRAIGDQPGVEDAIAPEPALAFARASAGDFEGVFWLHCGGRSRCGVLGDTGHALGLRLAGTAERNHETLRAFCQARRCLFVFADLNAADRPAVRFGGKASILFTSDFERPRPPREEVDRLFAAWPKCVDACVAVLGDAQAYLREMLENGSAAAEFGAAMVALLKHLDRLAEAYEVLDMMARDARQRGDVFRAHQLAWEQHWIAQAWGQRFELPPPSNATEALQLTLF